MVVYFNSREMKAVKNLVVGSLVVICVVTLFYAFLKSRVSQDINCNPLVVAGNQEPNNAIPSPVPSSGGDESSEKELARANAYLQSKGKPYPGIDGYIKYATMQRGLKRLSNVTPVRPDFGPVVNDVTSFKYPLNVPACLDSHQVFIAVISATENFEKRQMIRNTWIKHLDNTASLAFIVGKHANKIAVQHMIEEESAVHGDILQVDMVDTYQTLTTKVNGLLNWIHGQCPRIPFVYKCDDDIYVNVRNLATVLRHLPRQELTMYGSLHLNEFRVSRGEQEKWYLSYKDFPWWRFPPFFIGGSVLMNGQSIGPLLAAAQTTPSIWIDDVYLSGILSQKANVLLRQSPRWFLTYGDYRDPCFVSKTISWLTHSVGDWNKSHTAADNFYKNGTQCLLDLKSGSKSSSVLNLSSVLYRDILITLN